MKPPRPGRGGGGGQREQTCNSKTSCTKSNSFSNLKATWCSCQPIELLQCPSSNFCPKKAARWVCVLQVSFSSHVITVIPSGKLLKRFILMSHSSFAWFHSGTWAEIAGVCESGWGSFRGSFQGTTERVSGARRPLWANCSRCETGKS